MGDFYQISNQITLGKSEEELIKQVGDVVPSILSYERKARDFLLSGENQHELFDKVSRAYGTLQTAKKISSEETLYLLSQVRMGINLGLISDLEIPVLNKLLIHTQPAHLQKLRNSELNTSERNIERANYLHLHLRQNGGPDAEKIETTDSILRLRMVCDCWRHCDPRERPSFVAVDTGIRPDSA